MKKASAPSKAVKKLLAIPADRDQAMDKRLLSAQLKSDISSDRKLLTAKTAKGKKGI